MDVRQEFNEGLKRFVNRQTGVALQSAKVKSYDAGAKTIEAVLHDGTVLFEVNLSTMGYDRQIIHEPKIGSWVMIGEVGGNGSGLYFVLGYSEVQKITGKIGTTEFDIDGNGVKILRGSENLKTVFDELFTELTTSFTAISAVVPLPNLPKYALLKARLDSILK